MVSCTSATDLSGADLWHWNIQQIIVAYVFLTLCTITILETEKINSGMKTVKIDNMDHINIKKKNDSA